MMRLRHKEKDARPETAETIAPEVYPAESDAGDHALHLEGETCARCGRPIVAGQECRRRANGDCVHLDC